MLTSNFESLKKTLSAHFDPKQIAIGDDVVLLNDIAFPNVPQQTSIQLDMAIFGLCLDGNLQMMIDNNIVNLHRNSYVVVLPRQVIEIKSPYTLQKGIFICISRQKYTEVMLRLREMLPFVLYIKSHPCAELAEKDVVWLKGYHGRIFEEMRDSDNMFREQTYKSLLMAMLYKVCNIYGRDAFHKNEVHTRQDDIFIKYMDLVTNNFREHREVSWYAERLCITPKYLTTVVKHVSGKSVNEWIWNNVISEAKLELRTTHKPIQQIAEDLNFSSQSFFGKYFRQYTGMSPQAFRKDKA